MSLTPMPSTPLTPPLTSERRPLTPTAQLREAKLRLANDIENLLDTFTKLTDLSVSEISVTDLSVSEISVEKVSTYNPTPSITPTYNRHLVTLRISL